MAFILTIIFYYAEPDHLPEVHRQEFGSYIECDRSRVEALSKPPVGVKTMSATCVSGHLPKSLKAQ